ncbi:MAG TPA: hypothetical protein VN679_09185 [Candidatus Acidoferrales bacterium]|nr:hypothetical protein [Candidatus Acidoferrales bacterium]
MSTVSLDIIQHIAAAATDAIGSGQCKTLLYAEAGDGMVSVDLFSKSPEFASVQFRFASPVLQDLVYRFWESGGAQISPRSWATMQLLMEHGRFSIDFAYPNQLKQGEVLHDRRPRVITAHFPGLKVDYSLVS